MNTNTWMRRSFVLSVTERDTGFEPIFESKKRILEFKPVYLYRCRIWRRISLQSQIFTILTGKLSKTLICVSISFHGKNWCKTIHFVLQFLTTFQLEPQRTDPTTRSAVKIYVDPCLWTGFFVAGAGCSAKTKVWVINGNLHQFLLRNWCGAHHVSLFLTTFRSESSKTENVARSAVKFYIDLCVRGVFLKLVFSTHFQNLCHALWHQTLRKNKDLRIHVLVFM